MKLPIHMLITLLENEMTEERCDALALKVSKFIAKRGGIFGKIAGGTAYGVIDQVTPELLFLSLRSLFPQDHAVALDEPNAHLKIED